MEKSTLRIIKAIKNNKDAGDKTLKDTLIRFLRKEYHKFDLIYDRIAHTELMDELLHIIISHIFGDYMDSADNPSYEIDLVKTLLNMHSDNPSFDLYEALLTTLMLCDVAKDGVYVNGFDKSFLD